MSDRAWGAVGLATFVVITSGTVEFFVGAPDWIALVSFALGFALSAAGWVRASRRLRQLHREMQNTLAAIEGRVSRGGS